MTATGSPNTAWRSRRGHDSYDGLEPRFVELATLDPADRGYARLREDIILRCLPLAEHIALRFTGRGIEFDDLVQVARVGVLRAVDRFDPHRGTPFTAFAVPTIMGEVRRWFRDHGWALRVPRPLQELAVRITAVTPELTQRLCRIPTARDLADALEVDLGEVIAALVAADCYRAESLDFPIESSTGGAAVTVVEFLGADEPRYELLENAIAVGPLIEALPARDRQILIERFIAGRTQADLGVRFGVSQMQIHRILNGTLNTLREQVYAAPRRTPLGISVFAAAFVVRSSAHPSPHIPPRGCRR